MTAVEHDLPEGRRLTVALPEGYARSQSHYPTIYVLDERWALGAMVDTVTLMSMAREIPKCVVVGVGYQDRALAEVSERRAAEFTPTVAPFPDLTRVVGRHGSGGAGAFLDVLLSEMVPFIERSYRVDPSTRLLFGHSFSALCGLACFLTRPGVFSHYLLASPSIWWDDQAIESWPVPVPDLTAPSRLFLSAGGEEIQEPSVVLANADRFAERLRSGGHDSVFQVMGGESHFSTIGPAISAGLRHLIGTAA